MKVEVKEKDENPEYPKIMDGGRGVLVLFDKQKSGVVLRGDGEYKIGYYSCMWEMKEFKPFNGTITLSND